MISASHNPYRDNGIKFFGADGYKLTDEQELEIERELELAGARADGGAQGAVSPAAVRELRGAGEDYLRELHARFEGLDLDGLDVVLDCANGATYRVAPEIFRRLGATVTVLADEPDGRNINDGCGSTHIERLGGHGASAGGHDARLRLRRRRRPRAGGGPHGRGGGRRRAAGPGGTAPARARAPARGTGWR